MESDFYNSEYDADIFGCGCGCGPVLPTLKVQKAEVRQKKAEAFFSKSRKKAESIFFIVNHFSRA